ncbi:hypothetical protein HDV63DRAFT_393756 [Trichoderma sp. SZMC 28014]
MPQRPSSRDDFEIAIICALPLEYDAVYLLFDEFWDEDGDALGRAAGDHNHYTTGRIGKHDVVLALLPHMGKANAASAAASMRSSYGALRLVILAGICGGVPHIGEKEVFLGDVVISSSVIQYDFGRHYPNGFMRKNTYEDNLRKPDKNISSLLTKFDTNIGQDKLHERAAKFLKELQAMAPKHREKYTYPGTDNDKLFESSYRHMHRKQAICICSSCHGRKDPVCDEALDSLCEDLGCDEEYLERSRTINEQDEAQGPAIYIGAVASGDTVMKSGEDRDRIAKREGVIAFEMEGAGAWGDLPCIVVKGICDYADCHKNKLFQTFAAATAASVSKAILEQYIQTDRNRNSGRLIEEPPKAHFLVPFGRNQNFIGRQAILSSLLEKIRPSANKEDCQRTAIEGLGGVGKTQIALEAVYQLHDEHPDYSIFWVPAVDATGFENAYRNIGKQLSINEIDQDKADVKMLVMAALSKESSGSWLLVVDNADDVTLLFGDTELSAYLPFNRNGSILFTTRNHEAAARLDILVESIFSVTEMDQDEALSLLRRGLKDSQASNIEATKRLLDVLANLPLAIRQASAYMATKHISTADYLELCQSNHKDMITLLSKDFEDRHRYKEIQNPVATTWLISFNQILHNDALAAKYLQFMSMLTEKDIPKFLLPTSTRLETVDAIAILELQKHLTGTQGEATLVLNTAEKMFRQSLQLDEKLRGKDHLHTLFAMRHLANTLLKQKNKRQKLLGSDNLATLNAMNNLAITLSKQKKYVEAEKLHLQVLGMRQKLLGNDHLDTHDTMNNLANTLRRQRKYKEAEEMHRHVLDMRQKSLGNDHPKTLGAMCKYKESEEMHHQAFEQEKKVLGIDHPDTLQSMDNLAVVLAKLAKYEEEKVLGIHHPDTLQSKYKELEDMQHQVLKRREKVLGEHHLSTLKSMDNLAESEKLHREAIKRKEEAFGKDDPVYLDMQNYATSSILYQDARLYT